MERLLMCLAALAFIALGIFMLAGALIGACGSGFAIRKFLQV